MFRKFRLFYLLKGLESLIRCLFVMYQNLIRRVIRLNLSQFCNEVSAVRSVRNEIQLYKEKKYRLTRIQIIAMATPITILHVRNNELFSDLEGHNRLNHVSVGPSVTWPCGMAPGNILQDCTLDQQMRSRVWPQKHPTHKTIVRGACKSAVRLRCWSCCRHIKNEEEEASDVLWQK